MSFTTIGYDFFIHAFSATVASWGGGGGTTVTGTPPTVPAGVITGPRKRVLLHSIIALNAAATATPLTLLKGDGVGLYTPVGVTVGGNLNVPGFPMDMDCLDGLAILGGSAGSFLILFRSIG